MVNYKQNNDMTGLLSVVLAFLAVLFLLAMVPTLEDVLKLPLESAREPVPMSSAGEPMDILARHPKMPNFSLVGMTQHPQYVTLDIENRLPAPPDCRNLGFEECHWVAREAYFGNNHVLDVNLIDKNGRLVGHIQMMEMTAEEVGLAYGQINADTVWLSAIRVARAARMNGLGKLMWQAGDITLGILTAKDGERLAYHIFYDSAGWGASIRALIDNSAVIYQDAESFIYKVFAN